MYYYRYSIEWLHFMNKTGQSEFITLPEHFETSRREGDKLAVSVLLEDFKARWQELLNFENENNRWSTLFWVIPGQDFKAGKATHHP